MVDGKVWLRLRTAAVLRSEPVHQVENHLLRNDGIAVDDGDAFRAEASALRESSPIVDVRNGHVVKTARDAVRRAVAHHRNVDDFCHLARNDAREVADAARIFRVRQRFAFSSIADVIDVAPDKFSE